MGGWVLPERVGLNPDHITHISSSSFRADLLRKKSEVGERRKIARLIEKVGR